jgi:hypothetical protein
VKRLLLVLAVLLAAGCGAPGFGHQQQPAAVPEKTSTTSAALNMSPKVGQLDLTWGVGPGLSLGSEAEQERLSKRSPAG